MLLMAGREIHPRKIGKQNGTHHFCLNPSLQHLLRGAVLRLAAPFPSTTGIFCWFHSAATSRKTLLLDEDHGLALNQQRHDSPELGASNGSPRTPGVSSDESWGNGVTNCSVRPLGVGRSHAQPSSTGRCAVGDFGPPSGRVLAMLTLSSRLDQHVLFLALLCGPYSGQNWKLTLPEASLLDVTSG